ESSTVTSPAWAAPSIVSTNSVRLPSSTATRSPRLRPSFPNPAAICADWSATSRHVIRVAPQTSASPSGFRATASATIAGMLLGRSQNAGTIRSPKRGSSRIAGMECCDQSMAPSSALLHLVDVLGPRESARAHVAGVALDRRFDRGAELAIAANEFRRPRRQAQHVLQHQHLSVAGRAGANADGRNGDGLRDLARQRL